MFNLDISVLKKDLNSLINIAYNAIQLKTMVSVPVSSVKSNLVVKTNVKMSV